MIGPEDQIEEVIVFLKNPNENNKVIGIGASVIYNEIRMDVNILRNYNKPDIFFPHSHHSRFTYESAGFGTIGVIFVSVFHKKFFPTFRLERIYLKNFKTAKITRICFKIFGLKLKKCFKLILLKVQLIVFD